MKRVFDLAVSLLALGALWPVIAVAWALAARDTGASGFFVQERIGRGGHPFRLVKIRTMLPAAGTTVTTANDSRITPLGRRLRRWKIDELPQLWNVLCGEMSLVGPRPDVAGYLDRLQGADRDLLDLRPGITGPATLKYRDEETILARAEDPERENDEVIWPDKVRINLDYARNYRLGLDIRYILATFRLCDHGVS